MYLGKGKIIRISSASASVVASCMDDSHVLYFDTGCVLLWDETVPSVWLSTASVSCEAVALCFFCTFLSNNQSAQGESSQWQLERFKELVTSPYFWTPLSRSCSDLITVIYYSSWILVIICAVKCRVLSNKWCHCLQHWVWEVFSRDFFNLIECTWVFIVYLYLLPKMSLFCNFQNRVPIFAT